MTEVFTVRFEDRKRARKVLAFSPEDAIYKANKQRVLLVMPALVGLSGFSHLFDVTVTDQAKTVRCLVFPDNRKKWVSETAIKIAAKIVLDMEGDD